MATSEPIDPDLIEKCEDRAYIFEERLFFFIPLIYGIPTVYLHMNIVVVIIMKRNDASLKPAFFRIYTAYSITMVVMWCFDMLSTRFIGTGYLCTELLNLWGKRSYALSGVQFVMTFSRHAQFYAATVLSINRMTAVVYPTSYKQIWEKRWKTFMLLTFLLPLCSTWYLLPTKSFLTPYTLGGLTIKYVKILPNLLCSITFTTMVVISICALIILFTTILTYFKFLSYTSNVRRWSKVDKNLMIVGTTSSLTTFLLAIAEIPLYLLINYSMMSRTHFFIAICVKQIVIDLTFLFSGWSILLLSSAVRTSIVGVYIGLKDAMRAKLVVAAGNVSSGTKNNHKSQRYLGTGVRVEMPQLHTRSPAKIHPPEDKAGWK
ncbi:integral membrane protein, C.elegans Srg family [Necator americanus]|uniref:Serpentine receptor class gamma n=1 Tax=Necator americanus TaxID=51031 RepID=W2TIZ7_NECAM|nr:integral membrane protein, C.elegans Srg family [Necator americanus]ETN82080.1 integral membrane protein, C.elegans Srg family [Necator americanus]